MEICAISDIHHPYNDDNLNRAIEQMHRCDVVVIAGDVSSYPLKYKRVLDRFKGVDAVKLAVLGNHDVYCSDGEDSYERIGELEKICDSCGFHLLDKSPVVVGDVGFVGNMGWYDYQFAQKDSDEVIFGVRGSRIYEIRVRDMDDFDFSHKHYFFRGSDSRDYSAIWNDIRFVKWRFSDREFLDTQVQRLKQDIEVVSPKVDKLVYVSHHVPIKEFIYEKPEDIQWSVFNAYQGSPELSKAAFSDLKLRAVICGHSHIPNYVRINNVDCHDVSNSFGKLQPVFLSV
ncbi:MAG: metallophosphoesterase [archaeon]